MDMKLIDSLIELYKQLPESNSELAAQRVAILIDLEIEEMENSRTPITRKALIAKIESSIKKHLEFKAA